MDPPPADPPPPGDVTRPAGVDSTGFFVSGGRLYDKFGNDFVIRGVNNPHIWFEEQAYTALSAIAGKGANTVRIVWETMGEAAALRRVIERVIELQMIPMVELHDVTGNTQNARLLAMAQYYTRSDVRQVLLDFEDYLLVNVANEWSGMDFAGGYQAVIDQLREDGVVHTLVIDSNSWGQSADTILREAPGLLEYDPQHNLLFSVHMYESFAQAQAVTSTLESAVSAQIPLIIGEFGFQHGTPTQMIPVETILDDCARLGLGYIPWSWKGNSSDVGYLDMSRDWAGTNLTDWGRSVLEGPKGISETSLTASVFLLDS